MKTPATMIDTPKTDAHLTDVSSLRSAYGDLRGHEVVEADFARQLERENAELRTLIQRGIELCERGHGKEWALESKTIIPCGDGPMKTLQCVSADFARRIERENARLMHELERLMSHADSQRMVGNASVSLTFEDFRPTRALLDRHARERQP